MTFTSRPRAIARGAAAALGLAVVVVGVPLLLAAAGSPLHALAGLPDAVDGRYLPDDLLIAGLVIAGWFLWAEFTLITVVETVAVVRGRAAARVPYSGGLQHLIGRLVTTIALATALVHAAAPARPLPTGVMPRSPVLVAHVLPATTAVAPAPRLAPAAPLPVYVVRPHDDLWSIAERHLGDPLRWREIWALNGNRALPPNGEVFRDENLIRPGWVLTLPGDATGLEPAAPPPASAPPMSASPPTVTAPAPQPASPASTPADVHEEHRAAPQRAPVTHDQQHHSSAPNPASVLGVTLPALLAAYTIRRLDLLRRVQLRKRVPGRRLPSPPPDASAVETRLRAIAAVDAADWIDGTNRLLTTALASLDPASRPEVVAVRVGVLGVEVLLSRPSAAPDGFVSADDGRVWRLDPPIDLAELRARTDGTPAALVSLVTLGATPEGPLLVNLEHLGSLAVVGDPTCVEQFLAGVVLELTTAAWATDVTVHVAGPRPVPPGVERLEHAGAVRRLADAARIRASEPPGWVADVVVADSADVVDELRLVTEGGGLVLVHATPAESRHRLLIDADGAARLEPLGLRAHAAGLDVETTHAAATLLEVAGDETAGEELVIDLTDVHDEPVVANLEASTTESDPAIDPEVWIGVLGPVEVTGWNAEPHRAKVTELIVFLAVRGRAVGGDVIRGALWPDGVSDATLRSALSRSRRSLGASASGRDHLSTVEDGCYRLGPAVACDWQQFRALVRDARRVAEPAAAIARYRDALDLVRGAPFAEVAPNSYAWAWGEQVVSDIEVAVTAAAAELGRLALENGDHATAAWAAGQGLLVCPGHEALYQLRMTAAAEAGDVDAVEQAYRDAVRAAQALDPLDDVTPETHKLHAQLRGDLRRLDSRSAAPR